MKGGIMNMNFLEQQIINTLNRGKIKYDLVKEIDTEGYTEYWIDFFNKDDYYIDCMDLVVTKNRRSIDVIKELKTNIKKFKYFM